jgi:nicotinate-nucleotide pyrophosphorylase (carboxylating)
MRKALVSEGDTVAREFPQATWDVETIHDATLLIQLAVREDLDRTFDLTTIALVPPQALAKAEIRSRSLGIVAGLPTIGLTIEVMNLRATFEPRMKDGDTVTPGAVVGVLEGNAQDILVAERTMLNLLGKLSGVATITRRFVDAVKHTKVRIYDTRKTTPGYRRLEKYAVKQGGGMNHRPGLFSAILIKDNHLVVGREVGEAGYAPAEAVEIARKYLAEQKLPAETMLEIEVDSLEQLAEVLPLRPDIVLIDNFTPDLMREAVAMRDRLAPEVELEASGGVRLETVAYIAETGVDRISAGALTHSAIQLDFGLDFV